MDHPPVSPDVRRAAVVALALLAVVLAAPGALPATGLSRPTASVAPASPSVAPGSPPVGAPTPSVAVASPTPSAATAPPNIATASSAPSPQPRRTATEGTAVRVSQIVPGSVDRTSLAVRATYDADVTLGFDARSLRVAATIGVTNTSGAPIDRLELNTTAARLGQMRLGATTVDGSAVTAVVRDQTIIVPLGGILPPDATTTVTLAYRATLRSTLTGSSWLFTRVNGIVSMYRWLPWISRETPFDRPNHGDPFVTPVSPKVTVRITTDRPLVIAATGDRIATAGLTQTFVAENVRDFTITASPSYRTASRTVGNTKVIAYYRSGFPGAAALDQATKALSRMNGLVGAYPYRTFKVVQSAGGYGMESPGLIWIPTGVASGNLAYLVHHETAHQWFYGVVGSDQAREPFTDEALTDFLARYVLGSRRSSRCDTAALDRSIYQYGSTCYYEVVYIQGGNYLDGLRTTMGSSSFWKGLRTWIAEHRYGIATTRSLLETLDAQTARDLTDSFARRFPRVY